MVAETGTGFLQRVRLATRSLHDDLEQIVSLESVTASPDSCREALRNFYAVWKPLEDDLQRGPLADIPELELQDRMRARKIATDLKKLDDSQPLPAVEEMPFSIQKKSQATGVLYVLEGSAHGGAVIGKRLREAHNITPENGGSFFAAHGEKNPQMWRSFLNWAEANLDGEEIDEAVESACRVFEMFINRFSKR